MKKEEKTFAFIKVYKCCGEISTHDAFILANSALPGIMEGVNGWLLGDSGYPLKKWLLTPFAQPSNQHEERYNSSHCATRNTVERAFGVLKSRFRYLSCDISYNLLIITIC